MRGYNRWECPCCLKWMSANGLAKTNHQRKHVRAGEMTERSVYYAGQHVTVFKLTDAGQARRQQAEAERREEEQGG